MCTREIALKEMSLMGQGSKVEWEKKLGKDLYNEFLRLGYIIERCMSQGNSYAMRWQATDLLMESSKFYQEPTPEEMQRWNVLVSLGVFQNEF